MEGWVVVVIVVAVVIVAAIVGQVTGVMDFRGSGRDWKRTSGNILGPVDAIFAPNRQEAMREQERQTELPAPAPSPGDPPIDLERGIARITLARGDDDAHADRDADARRGARVNRGARADENRTRRRA